MTRRRAYRPMRWTRAFRDVAYVQSLIELERYFNEEDGKDGRQEDSDTGG